MPCKRKQLFRSCERQKPFNPQTGNMFAIILCLTLTSAVNSFEERTVFGKLKSGFQLAGKLLGIDHANGVAQLVTEAFGKTQRKGDASEGTSNIFAGFLRVLGFEPKKLGAIAVNAIIFVAQLISSSLTQKSRDRDFRSGSPFDWMMDSAPVMNLFPHIRDKDLPNHIVMHIKERALDEDTDCLQLLICKLSPFVWGMQRILSDNDTLSSVKGKKSLYAYLPSLEEVSDQSEICDKQHRLCLFEDF